MPVSSTQTLPNRVNGAADGSTLGPTTGSETNDPTLLNHTGTHYAYLDGTNTLNYLSVPDEAALDITDDLEIVARISADDWTPSSGSVIVNKNAAAFDFRIISSGALRLIVNSTNYDSTAAPSFTDGTTYWVKVTRDRSTGDIDFYTAADQATEPTSWTTLGTTVAGTTDAIATNSNALRVGQYHSSGSAWTGCVYRVIVRDTIGGTTEIVDINPAVDIDTSSDADAGQSSFTATTGQTVTVNRSTSGPTTTIVTRPVACFDGTDDYLQLPTTDTPTFTKSSGKYTGVIAIRNHVDLGNYDRIVSFESAANDGVYLGNSTGDQIVALYGDGGTPVEASSGSTPQDSSIFVAAFVVDDGTLTAYDNTNGFGTPVDMTSISTDGAFSAGRIGTKPFIVNSNPEIEFFDWLCFQDTALTEDQLDTLAAKLIAGTYT